ncbi:MAG: UvrD-helicase domain-containing protein [Bacteroidales bacterium]|nr:UvrD-helicase domain-containing protein [Bacteroidales bacterium]
MKQYDKEQSEVIRFRGGRALVLGAPGCGKTDILSVRVLVAHTQYGIPYSDMLCITFTNRASREMKQRIGETVGTKALGELFVGNLHRFCIRFLFDNEIVPLDACIIDDVDQEEIVREVTGQQDLQSYDIGPICDCASRDFMVENDFPEEIVSSKRVKYGYNRNPRMIQLAAAGYAKYKAEHRLIDFDDVLLLTYKALQEPDYRRYKYASYPWIQVDEVQDLNPLQFGIISRLLADDYDSIVYLGDERQAIYSFLGTDRHSLTRLRDQACSSLFRLSNNYRSPMYLLDMLNNYAIDVLHVDTKFLPRTDNAAYLDDGLTLVSCGSLKEQSEVAATIVRSVSLKNKEKQEKDGEAADESVGVLVRRNDEADMISDILDAHRIPHVKITKKDMFKSLSFKTLHSHFSVAANDTRFTDWTQLLYRFRACKTRWDAARFIARMRAAGMTPLDLMDHEDSSYLMEFDKSFREKEIVIFDTEATGLDLFEDDIIQIAAVKARGGKVVPGSEIDIIIRTDKEIPATLQSGLPNPMVEEYRRSSELASQSSPDARPDQACRLFMEPQEAFELFLNYIGEDELLGHNINFDIHILENNIRRRTTLPESAFPLSSGGPLPESEIPVCWDTLKIARLLDPNLKSHRLEALIQTYGLQGTNSHNAFDDIHATLSLAIHCHERMRPKLERQTRILAEEETAKIRKRLKRNYMPLYRHTISRLYSPLTDEEHSLLGEFRYAYFMMTSNNYIEPIEMYKYMCELFEKVVIDKEKEPHFYQQLSGHLHELRTFNEADLFQNGIIRERINVMTIHKAKGLEFDNVILFNISGGIFPPPRVKYTDEDARVLYVGMSRARKRLFITYQGSLTTFIKDHPTVLEHFTEMSQTQKQTLLNLERRYVKTIKN